MGVFNRVKRFISLVVVVCFSVTLLQPPSAHAISPPTEETESYKRRVRALVAKQKEIGLSGDPRKLLKAASLGEVPYDFQSFLELEEPFQDLETVVKWLKDHRGVIKPSPNLPDGNFLYLMQTLSTSIISSAGPS